MTTKPFSQLSLSPALLNNLASLGYHSMTEIQAESLPHTLAGRDIIARAKTGSGKTAAFSLALLNRVNPKNFAVQALVICPTRELSAQVAEETRRLARQIPNIKVLTLCGGQPIGPQIGSLEFGAHIVIGTPGRLQDHLRKRTLNIDQVTTLVLDEADRMLDMGFIEAIKAIASQIPDKRQTLLFSATYPDDIRSLSGQFQVNPVMVTVESVHASDHIQQSFYRCQQKTKLQALSGVLAKYRPGHAVVFCNTKLTCAEVWQYLRDSGYQALSLQGDMQQKDRDQTLVRFSHRSITMLVATDVAARGIDIDDLDAVVNYDLPKDTDVYTHRIGRTGRAGKAGVAISLMTEPDHWRYERIIEAMNLTVLDAGTLVDKTRFPCAPSMVTFSIDAGKKQKIRATDILGALTGTVGLAGDDVGKISIFPFVSYVSVKRGVAKRALAGLQKGKIKGRNLKARRC